MLKFSLYIEFLLKITFSDFFLIWNLTERFILSYCYNFIQDRLYLLLFVLIATKFFDFLEIYIISYFDCLFEKKELPNRKPK